METITILSTFNQVYWLDIVGFVSAITLIMLLWVARSEIKIVFEYYFDRIFGRTECKDLWLNSFQKIPDYPHRTNVFKQFLEKYIYPKVDMYKRYRIFSKFAKDLKTGNVKTINIDWD